MDEYIERKKLEEAFDNADPDVCESYPDGYSDWGFGRGNVRDVIRGVPAADVAPVVHGEWDGNDCTVCKLPWKYNMVQDADDWGDFDHMPDYCPNCGAKMDGGGYL